MPRGKSRLAHLPLPEESAFKTTGVFCMIDSSSPHGAEEKENLSNLDFEVEGRENL
jgi:hypothetical protein